MLSLRSFIMTEVEKIVCTTCNEKHMKCSGWGLEEACSRCMRLGVMSFRRCSLLRFLGGFVLCFCSLMHSTNVFRTLPRNGAGRKEHLVRNVLIVRTPRWVMSPEPLPCINSNHQVIDSSKVLICSLLDYELSPVLTRRWLGTSR